MKFNTAIHLFCLPAFVFLVACGGGESATPTASMTPNSSVTATPRPTSTATPTPTSTLPPNNISYVPLIKGQAVTGLDESKGSAHYFVISVPQNSMNFSVRSMDGIGRVSLELRSAGGDVLCQSLNNSTSQICQLANPQAGDYYIHLNATEDFAGVSVVADYELQSGGAGPSACTLSVTEQDLLNAHNQTRAVARRCGAQSFEAAPALTWNCTLAKTALGHSQDMADNNFFDHTNLNGEGPADRAVAQGYQYRAIGENIAAGQKSVQQVMDGWIASDGHCANIMSTSYKEMGAARVDVSGNVQQYSPYWTALFGQSR